MPVRGSRAVAPRQCFFPGQRLSDDAGNVLAERNTIGGSVDVREPLSNDGFAFFHSYLRFTATEPIDAKWETINTLVALPTIEFTADGKFLSDGKPGADCCGWIGNKYTLKDSKITFSDFNPCPNVAGIAFNFLNHPTITSNSDASNIRTWIKIRKSNFAIFKCVFIANPTTAIRTWFSIT